MSAAKQAPPNQIGIFLSNEDLAQIDQERARAVAGVPGATLSRSAWARQIIVEHLATLRAKIGKDADDQAHPRSAARR